MCGFEAVAIDCKWNKHRMRHPGIALDLTDTGMRPLLWTTLASADHIHMSPPTGTAVLNALMGLLDFLDRLPEG